MEIKQLPPIRKKCRMLNTVNVLHISPEKRCLTPCSGRSDRSFARLRVGWLDRSIDRLLAFALGGPDRFTRLPPCWPPCSGRPYRSLARLCVPDDQIELLARSPPPASSSSSDRRRARMNARLVEQAHREACGSPPAYGRRQCSNPEVLGDKGAQQERRAVAGEMMRAIPR
jgi:hypothetical protein